jgi:hypothetical protein
VFGVLPPGDAWAEYEREQSQYPKWATVGSWSVRVDDDSGAVVVFGLGGPIARQSVCGCVNGNPLAWCTREQAVTRLTEILRDPAVAWAGYKAKVFVIMSDSRWWWGVRDTEVAYPSGHAPTEPAAREALAAWLLDHTMKETKP